MPPYVFVCVHVLRLCDNLFAVLKYARNTQPIAMFIKATSEILNALYRNFLGLLFLDLCYGLGC